MNTAGLCCSLRAAGAALGIAFAGLAAAADDATLDPARSADAGTPAHVEQPRAFGHVVGDVLRQRVLLEQEGRAVEPASLPAAQRAGPWMERRAARIDTDDRMRRWLVVDHQVLNAPRKPVLASIPELRLTLGSGSVLVVPAWTVGIGPLVPEDEILQGRMPVLQPAREVERPDTSRLARRFQVASAATLALLLAWATWWAWRNARDRQLLPFARAWREIGPLDPARPEAWQALHRAIDASADRAVHSASLDSLLDEQVRLRTLKAPLESFFAHSNARFFGTTGNAAPPPTDFDLRGLSRALRDLERRHPGPPS